jgi:hypothetical protein
MDNKVSKYINNKSEARLKAQYDRKPLSWVRLSVSYSDDEVEFHKEAEERRITSMNFAQIFAYLSFFFFLSQHIAVFMHFHGSTSTSITYTNIVHVIASSNSPP